ncbi:ABC transporter ATP-binding protein [candidate division WOR-3 bacterium]|nr:ABC transporter ATP-binding protein [candidate division WOR-3 bacterium]
MAQRPKSGLRVVFDFWRRHKLLILALVFTTVLGAAAGVAFPYILRLIIDGIKQEITSGKLLHYCVLLVSFGVLRAALDGFLPFLRGRTNELFAWEFRSRVFREIIARGYRFTSRFPSGDVMERLDHDMQELSWFACSGIFRFLAAFLLALFTVVMMIKMNLLLTVLTVMPASLAVIGWMKMGPQIYTWFMKWREKIAEINNQLQAAFSGIRLVKAFVIEKQLGKKFNQALAERVGVAVQEAKAEARVQAAYMAIAEIALLMVLWAGGIFVIRQRITLGEFVAFNAYLLMLLGPMFDIGNLFVSGRRAAGAGERIVGLIEAEPEVAMRSGVKMPEPGELKLERVSFNYDNKPVLKDVTMVFPPGKKLGIAGTVGSGKSTVLYLLMRLIDPTRGSVLLNGKDIREYNFEEYRRLFGYAPQEPTLFSDTLKNNIRFGREVSDEELRQVVAMAQLTDVVAELPRGIDEMLGERGSGLSGGQKARVAIARALVNMPPILVLDDVTAALDADTERELLQRLFEAVKDRTLIVVSHRLAVLAACDYIYMLDQGEVKEAGKHDELLMRRGLYWRIYQRQLITEELEKI